MIESLFLRSTPKEAATESDSSRSLKPECTLKPDQSKAAGQIHWLAGRLAGATLVLMAIGSATRVMNAGLACPDWPLCYGQLLPSQQMNLQVFLEWFHRLDASIVGFGTIALVALSLLKRRLLPRWVLGMAIAALGLVLFQGALGAFTVTELLRFDIVTAHLGTALLFFSLLLTLTMSLKPYEAVGSAGYLRWCGLAAALLVYGQSILGGLVASQWALHQCLAGSQLCKIMSSHILGVFPATAAVLTLVVLTLRKPAVSPLLRRLAMASGLALAAQASLGVAALRLRLQVEPLTVSHQLVGATLLGLLISFTVIAWRDQQAVARPTLNATSTAKAATSGAA